VAGSILGINAFDQPDVEASKVATRQLTTEYEQKGKLPAETPILDQDGIKIFTDERHAQKLRQIGGSQPTLSGLLGAHLSQLNPGDYFALLVYIQMNVDHEEKLQSIRQAYKGGPNIGVFLQVTCDDAADIPVPGQKYTFGVVKAAQARGDFQVLAER